MKTSKESQRVKRCDTSPSEHQSDSKKAGCGMLARRLCFSLLLEFDGLGSSSLLGLFGHARHGLFNCVKRRVKVIVEPTYQACHKTIWGLAARLRYGDEGPSAPLASTRCSLDLRSAFRALHLFTTRPTIWSGFPRVVSRFRLCLKSRWEVDSAVSALQELYKPSRLPSVLVPPVRDLRAG